MKFTTMQFTTMKFAWKTLAFTLLLSAACLTASAQEQIIKFTLPEAAQIGSVDLPAGNYRMMLSFGGGMRVVSVSGEAKDSPSVMTIPTTVDSDRSCGESSVTLKRSQGKLAMTSACFANNDLAIEFLPLTSKKSAMAAAVEPGTSSAGAQ